MSEYKEMCYGCYKSEMKGTTRTKKVHADETTMNENHEFHKGRRFLLIKSPLFHHGRCTLPAAAPVILLFSRQILSILQSLFPTDLSALLLHPVAIAPEHAWPKQWKRRLLDTYNGEFFMFDGNQMWRVQNKMM